MKIQVEFIDDDRDEFLGAMEVPSHELPVSFEPVTTIHIRSEHWKVVSAEPLTRAEFESTGTLRLRLSKVEEPDPEDLLYSLPTISDGLPEIARGSSRLRKRVLALHEDDWRQVEFVSTAADGNAARELRRIRRVVRNHRSGSGYDDLHLRCEMADPLAGTSLSLAEVAQALGPGTEKLDGIAFSGKAGLVDGGFAFLSKGGLHVYGRESGGRVSELAVARYEGHSGDDGEALGPLAASHGLSVVDWCRTKRAGAAGLQELFAGL